MKVVQGLIDGENTADELIKHIHGWILNKNKDKVKVSLVGVISPSDRLIFRQNYQEYELRIIKQQECVAQMEQLSEK